MSQGEDILKSLSATLEGLKNSQSLAYFQQQNGDSYNQMHKQKNNYNNNYLTQDEQNLHYLEDSPEPEHFEFQNVNDPHEQLNQMYQNRQMYKQQQSNGGFSSTSKPYYKNTYENSHSNRSYNNQYAHNQMAQNQSTGYQGQRVSNYNRFQGQQTSGYQGQNYIPSSERNFSHGAKYQGQKPQGGFNAHHQNHFSQPSQQIQGQQQYQGQTTHTYPQGEKPTGGIHIEGTKIFINNIEPTVSQEEIHHYFEPHGKINDLKVFHRNGQNYAYVIFEKYEDAFRATTEPCPQPNWTVSLAKSKNTVMQYQQSTLFNPSQEGSNPNPPYTGSNKFHNASGNPSNPLHFKKPFNKFNQNPSIQNQHPNPRYEKSGGFNQNYIESQNGEKILQNISNLNDSNGINTLGEALQNHKTQINQTILVREIWISNIDEKCKPYIRELIEDFFGGIEEVEFFDRGKDSFAFIKFYMVQTAYLAFTNKDKIAELLETEQVKLTYSDPSRRRNIIGDHEDYMRDENLSPVLYISFPYGFKVKKSVIQKIASDYGTVLNVTLKRSEDPKQTSSVLVEFQDLKDAKFTYKHMREDHDKMHPKCEFAILLNSEKFVKENNLKLKEKIKPTGLPGQVPSAPYTSQKPYGRRPINQNPNINPALSDIAGVPIQKQIQSKGRQFSPEKDQEINAKRSFNQYKQNAVNTSQDHGYNPDQQDVELLAEDDDDDENFIWSGFISINKKGRCGMDAKIIQSQGQFDLDSYNLIMTTKCQIIEPLRFPPYSVLIFRPSNETEKKPFKDVKTFLNSNPNQAGVIHTKNLTIYMLPSTEQALKFYPQLKEGNILALCHNMDTIRGNQTKKETKYDEKLLARQQASLNNSHDDGEEDNLIYDPTSILQDTSKPNGKKVQQNRRYEHDEENYQDENIYDPNKINISKDDPKTDISDLIDNPSLMDNMLKSFY